MPDDLPLVTTVAAALGERLLRDLGRDEAAIRREGERIRRGFAGDGF